MATKKVNFRLVPVPDGQTELDQQISNNGDDFSASEQESEEDSEDELRHDKLVKAISTLSDKGGKRLPQRSEPNLKVSEYHLNAESNKVELHDLVGALHHEGSFANLKKKLDGLQKSSVLDVPLPKPQAEQVVRSVAYDETAKDISKWAPIVKKNREAEHLSFPMNAYEPSAPSTKTMTVTFKPSTPLEQEIAAVLRGSAHVLERNNEELSKEEEEALMAMDLEEAKERRHELQRLRALQSYYEQKCKRQKKIKSKKYHRIKRRAEKREASKKSIEDPEKAKEELQKADRLRMMERMSLKHKNTSKWARNLLVRGHKDPEAKRALAEQLHISQELTKKTLVESEDEEQEALDDKDVVDDITTGQFAGLVTSEDNPWSLDTKGDSKLEASSSSRDLESSAKMQRLQPITKEDTGEAGANEPDDSESGKETEDEFELQPVKTNAKKKSKNKKEGKKMDKNKEKTKVSKQKKQKDVEEQKRRPKTKQKNGKKLEKTKVSQQKRQKDVEEQKRRPKTKEKKGGKLKKVEKKTTKTGREKGNAEGHTSSADGLQESILDNDKNIRNVEAEMNLKKSTPNQGIKVDPKKFFRIEDDGTGSEQPGPMNEDGQQLIDIRQAFANDDVIEEFVQEKDDIIAASRPKDVDLFLPGWGEWAGAGVKPSVRKKKKFVVPAEPAPPRKDDNLAHVIINEERNNRLAKHQVSSLPHPYTNQVQFERSIRNPLGPQWNTTSMVKELTKPKVSTLPGVIIDPIKPTKEVKRRRPDQVTDNKEKRGKRFRRDNSQSHIIIHN